MLFFILISMNKIIKLPSRTKNLTQIAKSMLLILEICLTHLSNVNEKVLYFSIRDIF